MAHMQTLELSLLLWKSLTFVCVCVCVFCFKADGDTDVPDYGLISIHPSQAEVMIVLFPDFPFYLIH